MKGVYKGFWITFHREWEGYIIYFLTYEYTKNYLETLSKNELYNYLFVPIMSGGIAGISSWFGAYPIDTMKTLQQSDSFDNP